jgi:DNA polymerase-3 subunit epsilon
LDAQLTAEVYLELIGGRQRGLMLAPVEIAAAATEAVRAARQRPEKLTPLITAVELEIHAVFVARELGDKSIWNA